MATAKPRFSILVDEELLERIDDFMYSKRMRSRSAAAVLLIQMGLDSLQRRAAKETEVQRLFDECPAIAQAMVLDSMRTAISQEAKKVKVSEIGGAA